MNNLSFQGEAFIFSNCRWFVKYHLCRIRDKKSTVDEGRLRWIFLVPSAWGHAEGDV